MDKYPQALDLFWKSWGPLKFFSRASSISESERRSDSRSSSLCSKSKSRSSSSFSSNSTSLSASITPSSYLQLSLDLSLSLFIRGWICKTTKLKAAFKKLSPQLLIKNKNCKLKTKQEDIRKKNSFLLPFSLGRM